MSPEWIYALGLFFGAWPGLEIMNFSALKRGLVVALAFALLGWSAPSLGQSAQPVLVELFTSQGCSACPPADAFMSKLKNHANVVALAWHVDYWDDKGWVDPFSNRAFSQRQISYAKAFKSERIYTPQMVVDGRTGFNGSDRRQAQIALRDAGNRNMSRILLSAEVATDVPNIVVATVRFERHSASEVVALAGIILAVTEDNLTVTIDLGENGGRTLHHDAVVRWARVAGETAGDRFENTVSGSACPFLEAQ